MVGDLVNWKAHGLFHWASLFSAKIYYLQVEIQIPVLVALSVFKQNSQSEYLC